MMLIETPGGRTPSLERDNKTRARPAILFFPLLLLSMMAACASVPKEDLKSYSDAFAEAQQAGNLYLDEVATAAQVLAEREALANPASADAGSEDSDFDPRTVPSAGASADPPAVT